MPTLPDDDGEKVDDGFIGVQQEVVNDPEYDGVLEGEMDFNLGLCSEEGD